MANKGINTHIDNVISVLNTKADTNLANSAKAYEIESIAESAASAANSANIVAQAASELINTSLPTKVNKFGDTINGNLIVDGNMTVTGEINATITGSSESAMSATKDSNGNIIVDTYATKNDIVGVVRSVDNKSPNSAGNVIVSTLPSTVYINLALPSNGGTVTVSEDGYLRIGGTTNGDENGSAIYLGGRVRAEGYCYRNKAINIFIPVCRGDVVTVGYEGVNITYFDLVYTISATM